MESKATKNTLLIATSLIAVCLGIWYGFNANKATVKPEISGFAFPDPKKLHDVNLIDQNNKPFNESAFKNHWTFVYVGYTFCPDACPTALTVMNQIFGLLEKQNNADNVRLLLVSVDPDRDTPDRLHEYTTYFNAHFLAATGDPQEINNFAKQVSAVYSLPQDRSDPNYLVDHSSTIILIDPQSSVHAIFTPPQVASELATDFEKLRNSFNSNR